MNFDIVENTLKSLLLREIKILSKRRVLGTGTVLLYELKDFNIKLHFTSGKKVEILYPFSIQTKNNVVYFDYTLMHIHQDDLVEKPKIHRMVKNVRNKYYDIALMIEKL